MQNGTAGAVPGGAGARGIHPPQGPSAAGGKTPLTLKGKSLNAIPGVTKGFENTIQSSARQYENEAQTMLFSAGDRVRHPKFGKGTVTAIEGRGAGARITVRFDDGNERMLALSVAPIVRMEEEE